MFWAKVIAFITGGGLSGIAQKIEDAYEAKLRAQNDSERIAADERIAMLQAERDTILAAQNNRTGQLVRAAWAAPFIIYNFKVVLWDKFVGGVTDPLSAHLAQIEMVILGGYFLMTTARQFRR